MNPRVTVTWNRLRLALRGSAVVRGGDAGTVGVGSWTGLARVVSSGWCARRSLEKEDVM